MITPAYSQTATERVLPRMALDFTTGVLDSRVTITRALNTATAVNSSGFIAVVNANLPRFDYDPSTLAPKGLLIEESRANIFIQSQFQSNWTANAGTTTFLGTYVTSPDGTSNGRILNDTSAAAAAYVFQGVSFTNAATYTLSVYVKKGVSRYFALNSFTQSGRALFDLNNYSLSSVTGIVTSATITAVGGGWYRCTATMTANATGTNNLGFGDFEAGPTGDLYYLWGAQIEAGAFATSYIPTTTTSLARNADVVQMTGTNFSSWYNATSGAILARARQSVITGTRPSIYMSNGTANNIISLRGLAANPELYIKATTDQAQIDAGTLTANSSFGLVGAWTTDNCAAAINGGAAVTDTSATIPTVDQMLIGSDGTNYLNGQVERISYWPQRIINAEAQAFSK